MISTYMDNGRSRRFPSLVAVVMVVTLSIASAQVFAAVAKQKTFPSANAAVNAAVGAAKSGNANELLAIFGPSSKELLFSGDAVADKERRATFMDAYDAKHSLVIKGSSTVLVIGEQAWPFPIPVVKQGKVWLFDTNKGKKEILNRRIGQNEMEAIQVCLAYVDAQREYAISGANGGLREYALKFRSDPGQRNGLYWQTAEGEQVGPLGPLVSEAKKEGYQAKGSGSKTAPYHGYCYRILKGQGKHALGGAFNYVVNGHMILGFAAVAYPAEYGNSGVMTFIVNHEGVVYQKMLGANTAKIAEKMTLYDPDPTWKKVK